MIKIYYSIIENKITYLESKGHANYADKGKDIVCSAVSAILVGGVNAIIEKNNYSIKIENGLFNLKTIKNDTLIHDNVVLETILIQLFSIENSYGDYIQIKKINKEN